MKDKYIEERFHTYFMFGDLSDVDGSLSDERIIQDRDKVLDMIKRLANALDVIDPVIFKEIWYNDKEVSTDSI